MNDSEKVVKAIELIGKSYTNCIYVREALEVLRGGADDRIAKLRIQHDWVMENVKASEGRDDACIGIDAAIALLERKGVRNAD